MKEYLVKIAHYNLWANQKMISMIPRDEHVFNQTVKSSFPSIAATLLHIWDAQVIWLTRLQDQPILDFPSKRFKGSAADICEGLTQSSEEFYLFLDKQLPTYPGKSVNYKTISGEAYSSTTVEVVAHCVNHGTFHRGQLITILRELGITNLVSTDMIAYNRQMLEVKKEIRD